MKVLDTILSLEGILNSTALYYTIPFYSILSHSVLSYPMASYRIQSYPMASYRIFVNFILVSSHRSIIFINRSKVLIFFFFLTFSRTFNLI